MLKKISIIVGFFVVGMVGGIFANEIFWPYFVERHLFYQYDLEQRPVYLTETKEVYIQENVALVEAVEKAERTVVAVRTETTQGRFLEGSGFVVTSDGLIVTLAELVPQGAEFNFFVNNQRYNYQVIKRDTDKNLVLIKLEDNNLVTTGFARTDDLKIGERVFLVGNIFENRTGSIFVNEGIIKHLGQNLIKTSIIESSFLAGSPLFNIMGEVVGISTIDANGNVDAIPVSIIREFVGI